ncbi:hypothetical protein CMI47_16480 [Candidatus Pacearchaeota archaeon]|jgi:regulator of replication initiation timing|nr:hypothetical protein [Candidatus Pacearchaeota archaeon]
MIETDPRADLNQELYRKWRDARSDWDTEARNDIDFYMGNHFTSDESDELNQRNQPDVPMDRISPAIEKLKAVLTSRPPVFTASPREDSDAKMAKVWQTILGYVWDSSDGDAHIKDAIHDYAVTGLGYLYVYTDRESDFGRGDIKFTHINPFRVYVPPSSRDRWFNDAEGIILSTILTGEQVVSLYPELGPQVDEETGEVVPGIIEELDAYNDEDYPDAQNKNSRSVWTPSEAKDLGYADNKYQVLERFYKTKVPFYRISMQQEGQQGGVTEMVLSEGEFQMFLEDNPGIFENGQAQFEQIMQTRIGVTSSLGQVVLEEYVLNINEYPLIPMPNNWTETPYSTSDVSRARPQQRLLNKLWQLAISHAQASAGLKLLVPVGSAIDGVEQLEKDWANPNAVIEVDTSQGEPHYPAPTPLAAEFYKLIQQCEHYIDFIFGLPEMMHGFPDKAPETSKGTDKMIALGSDRPKSKLRDIEFSITKLGRVIYGLAKNHYTYEKMFRLVQPNNDMSEVTINLYDDKVGTIVDIKRDRNNIWQHDIRIVPGSTLPTSKWAEFGVYLDAYKIGLIDRTEVLKKNPEIFDKAGVLQRMSEIAQLSQQLQGAQEQIKKLKGDLQTAERESVHNRKQVEVSKFKSRLHDILTDAKADNKVKAEKIANMVKSESERLRGVGKEMESEIKNQVAPYGIPVSMEDFGTS